MSNKKQKAQLTMKALEQLLAKIETDIKRARLLIHSLITENFDNLDKKSEEELKLLAEKLATYQEDEAVKVVE